MTVTKRFRTAGIVLLAALALLFTACPNLTQPETTVTHTVSGRVLDATTGAGISGATVILGSYKATTDSSGGYAIELAAGESEISGDMAVVKGTDYDFYFLQGGILDASSDPSDVDLRIKPVSPPQGAVTMTVSLTGLSSAQLSTVSSFRLIILSENRGVETLGGLTNGSSATVHATGSDCTVFVTIYYTDFTQRVFYLKNVNITATGTLDLAVPSEVASGAIPTVNVDGATTGNGVMSYLVVPGRAAAIITWVNSAPSPQFDIPVYNPDNYAIIWCQGAGGSRYALAAPQAFTNTQTVHLPQLTLAPPSTGDTVSDATYSNGTLTFSANANASRHLVKIGPTAASDTGLMGHLILTAGSVTFPQEIQAVIQSVSGWDINSVAANVNGLSGPHAPAVLSLLFSSVGGAKSATEVALASGASATDFYSP